MSERDEGFLGDMLEIADKILLRAHGIPRDDYDADEDRQIVFTHLVQLIGEAASRISPETRVAHPEVAWKQIVGTRHRIVHDYLHVDTDILWEIVTTHVPQLHDQLVAILQADSNEASDDQSDEQNA